MLLAAFRQSEQSAYRLVSHNYSRREGVTNIAVDEGRQWTEPTVVDGTDRETRTAWRRLWGRGGERNRGVGARRRDPNGLMGPEGW
jgi:hypothetical protein